MGLRSPAQENVVTPDAHLTPSGNEIAALFFVAIRNLVSEIMDRYFYLDTNSMESFFQAISRFTTLSQEAKRELSAVLKLHEFSKGHFLTKPDSVCSYLYFIEKGLTRTFYFKDGKDVTDWISAEDSFAVSVISFITQKPDRRGIELLEHSKLYAVSYYDLEKLSAKHHDIERLIRHLVSFGLIQLQRKFDDLHFATAQQRYQTLMDEHPSFIQRVPLGMIASYLGITQETLSRIRANRTF